jgi:hypothetical protein
MAQDYFLDLKQINLINIGNKIDIILSRYYIFNYLNLFQYQKQIKHMKVNQLIFLDHFVERH